MQFAVTVTGVRIHRVGQQTRAAAIAQLVGVVRRSMRVLGVIAKINHAPRYLHICCVWSLLALIPRETSIVTVFVIIRREPSNRLDKRALGKNTKIDP